MVSWIFFWHLLFYVTVKEVCSTNEYPDHTYAEPEYLENLLATGQYEEFARLLHIDDVNLVKPAEGDRPGDPMFNEGLEGGDILMTPWQKEQARQGVIWESSSNSKWKRVVPYVIDSKSYTQVEKDVILKAIRKWNQNLFFYIRFRPRNPHIDNNYVWIFSGAGCYSNLGKVGGQQPISLKASGCLSEGTIQHEMAHTVGIIHEHNRPDRDKYIKILPENIPTDWQSQYEKSSHEDIRILGPYDYHSVMHYPILAPKTNEPAFAVRQKNINLSRIGQREAQTKTDINKIKKLYS